MDYALEVKGLSKTYKKSGFTLDNVSFTVPKGTIVGLVGENGAGKSTTIGCILNTIFRDRGEVKLLGQEMRDEDTQLRQRIGVVYDGENFPGYYTAEQLAEVFLLLPFLTIRFLLPFILNPKALARAAYFAPVQGREKAAYYIYQISNIAMFIYLLFLNVLIENSWQFYTGIVSYILGLGLCSAAMVNFSFPDEVGFNNKGLYKFSRNPMYVAYFICFIGMALLTQSWILLGVVMLFQISAHWIILAEERWCILKFEKAYREYMKRVRRYI